MTTVPTAEAAIREHLRAFNEGDLPALLGGFAEDAHWLTGRSSARGRAELEELFADAITALRPRLTLRHLVASGDLVAVELTEALTHDGREQTFPIAGFFELRGGLITSARIYREGSAELD
jgi:ketosteroid isomerase-like protein